MFGWQGKRYRIVCVHHIYKTSMLREIFRSVYRVGGASAKWFERNTWSSNPGLVGTGRPQFKRKLVVFGGYLAVL